MNAPAFTTADAKPVASDPSKHVNYTQGMVLGVDDFTQEFAYLDNRDQWHAREAIGYGTVTGLHVGSSLKDGAHEIRVSPGVAISPRGQLIRVGTPQCATIEAWLQLETTRTQLTERGIAAGSSFNAYVVLCYRDCPVDELPVPGEPCRCDSETMAPSRIQDDFRLELTLQPPPQREEDAVRSLVGWLRSLPVHDFNPTPGELDTFLNALRREFQSLLSPPATEPQSSPPGSPPEEIRLPRGQICEWMRAALRLWVTELRPLWQEQWRARAGSCSCGCGGASGCHGTGDPIPEQGRECLLLARVAINRSGAFVTSVALNEDDRPFLVHLRMLQELVLCGRGRGLSLARTFGTVFTVDAHTIRLWLHYPEAVTVPEAALTLRLNGIEHPDVSVAPVQPNVFDLSLPASPPDLLAAGVTIEVQLDAQQLRDAGGHDLAGVFASSWYRFNDYEEPILHVYGYADAFPPDPIPAHVADVDAHANHEVKGDVQGTLANTRVARLQGRLLLAPNPQIGQFLQFVAAPTSAPVGSEPRWVPATLSMPSVPVGSSNNNDIVAETSFGMARNAGSSSMFARANHTHGTPPNPIPLHEADTTAHLAHQIQGDVEQTLNNTFIDKIQNVKVIAPNPKPDDVLQFDKGRDAWMAKPLNLGGSANAVEHPPSVGPYFVVAAGILDFAGNLFSSSYNELRIVNQDPSGDIDITFGPAAGSAAIRYVRPVISRTRPRQASHTYIVKGHTFGGGFPSSGFLHVLEFRETGIRIRFIPGRTSDKPVQQAMIEISCFGKI